MSLKLIFQYNRFWATLQYNTDKYPSGYIGKIGLVLLLYLFERLQSRKFYVF